MKKDQLKSENQIRNVEYEIQENSDSKLKDVPEFKKFIESKRINCVLFFEDTPYYLVKKDDQIIERVMDDYDWMKWLSRAYLDVQKVRIELGNRLIATAKVLDCGLKDFSPKNSDSWMEYFDEESNGNKNIEESLQKAMMKKLIRTREWKEFFEPIKGIGPVIACSIIGEIGDLKKFSNPAKLWTFAGYGMKPEKKQDSVQINRVTQDPSDIKDSVQAKREIQVNDDKDSARRLIETHNMHGQKFVIQKREKGQRINWDPYLQLALWKFGESINKVPNSEYGKLMASYKSHEAESHEFKCPKCKSPKGHVHNRALRWIKKRLLKDYWIYGNNLQNKGEI